MSGIIDQAELDGLREDFDEMMGIRHVGGVGETFDEAKTLITISRTISKGDLNQSTGKYDDPNKTVIYSGPCLFSPVTYRRDRQELGGMESIRIRQYRAVVPWDAGDIWIDDEITFNFSEDPDVVGRTFNITDVMYEDELSARRLSFTDTSKDGMGSSGEC